MKKKGFTLIEIIIAIVLIAIISSFAYSFLSNLYFRMKLKASAETIAKILDEVKRASFKYKNDKGVFPSSIYALVPYYMDKVPVIKTINGTKETITFQNVDFFGNKTFYDFVASFPLDNITCFKVAELSGDVACINNTLYKIIALDYASKNYASYLDKLSNPSLEALLNYTTLNSSLPLNYSAVAIVNDFSYLPSINNPSLKNATTTSIWNSTLNSTYVPYYPYYAYPYPTAYSTNLSSTTFTYPSAPTIVYNSSFAIPSYLPSYTYTAPGIIYSYPSASVSSLISYGNATTPSLSLVASPSSTSFPTSNYTISYSTPSYNVTLNYTHIDYSSLGSASLPPSNKLITYLADNIKITSLPKDVDIVSISLNATKYLLADSSLINVYKTNSEFVFDPSTDTKIYSTSSSNIKSASFLNESAIWYLSSNDIHVDTLGKDPVYTISTSESSKINAFFFYLNNTPYGIYVDNPYVLKEINFNTNKVKEFNLKNISDTLSFIINKNSFYTPISLNEDGTLLFAFLKDSFSNKTYLAYFALEKPFDITSIENLALIPFENAENITYAFSVGNSYKGYLLYKPVEDYLTTKYAKNENTTTFFYYFYAPTNIANFLYNAYHNLNIRYLKFSDKSFAFDKIFFPFVNLYRKVIFKSGNYLYQVSLNKNYYISLNELNNATKVYFPNLKDFSFSPDGFYLVITSSDNYIKIYSLSNAFDINTLSTSPIRTFYKSNLKSAFLYFYKNKYHLITITDDTIDIYLDIDNTTTNNLDYAPHLIISLDNLSYSFINAKYNYNFQNLYLIFKDKKNNYFVSLLNLNEIFSKIYSENYIPEKENIYIDKIVSIKTYNSDVSFIDAFLYNDNDKLMAIYLNSNKNFFKVFAPKKKKIFYTLYKDISPLFTPYLHNHKIGYGVLNNDLDIVVDCFHEYYWNEHYVFVSHYYGTILSQVWGNLLYNLGIIEYSKEKSRYKAINVWTYTKATKNIDNATVFQRYFGDNRIMYLCQMKVGKGADYIQNILIGGKVDLPIQAYSKNYILFSPTEDIDPKEKDLIIIKIAGAPFENDLQKEIYNNQTIILDDDLDYSNGYIEKINYLVWYHGANQIKSIKDIVNENNEDHIRFIIFSPKHYLQKGYTYYLYFKNGNYNKTAKEIAKNTFRLALFLNDDNDKAKFYYYPNVYSIGYNGIRANDVICFNKAIKISKWKNTSIWVNYYYLGDGYYKTLDLIFAPENTTMDNVVSYLLTH